MQAPLDIRTERLVLRKPVAEDAAAIYARYAGDAEVCRYLAWPMHKTIDDTLAFIDWSDAQWRHWPAGPYLLWSHSDGTLVGSTGLAFERRGCASTGYVVTRDHWGLGYAGEALHAMQRLAAELEVERLASCCHRDHQRSRRVLEKGGFTNEGLLRKAFHFPNFESGGYHDIYSFSWLPGKDPLPDRLR